MQREGPALEVLLRRLMETPEDFLGEPRIGRAGMIEVPAVVGDLLRSIGGLPDPAALGAFAGAQPQRDRNRLTVVLILCWLLADEWFRHAQLPADAVLRMLRDDAAELAGFVAARKLITDPDRREELVRFLLARLSFRPAGETETQAQDRFTSLSTAERTRVLAASQAAARRAREVREALARKAAEEAADKYTRE